MSLVLLLIGLHFPCFLSEFFMQDLSYNLGRVRAKEQLLKSVLLYSFDQEQATSMTTQCYLDVKEQDAQDQCLLCPSTHHSFNFLFHTNHRRKWVEVIVDLVQYNSMQTTISFLREIVLSIKMALFDHLKAQFNHLCGYTAFTITEDVKPQ